MPTPSLAVGSASPHTPSRADSYFFLMFAACLVILATLSLYFFPHVIQGDAVSYVNAMQMLAGEVPTSFAGEVSSAPVVAHRMLTTILSIQTVRVFSALFGSIKVGWLVWDTILFFAISILFYQLLARLFESSRIAFLGGIFFVGNYAMLTSGLGFFMDIGGWFFYILSIFLLLTYIDSGKYRDIFLSALAIAVGGLFKENALVAAIPLTVILLYENWGMPVKFLSRSIPLGLMVLIPLAIQHTYIYLQYGYTYASWIRLTGTYHYSSRVVEYMKSLGSLLTFLAPVTLLGAITFIRPSAEFSLDIKRRFFIVSVLVSSLPAVLWLAITQRVLFMVVPGCILFACVFIKRYERYWYAFLPVVLFYVLAGFFMDSFILTVVNLPF